MPGNYVALEAARRARDDRDFTKAAYTLNESRERSPRFDRNDYAVAKVFDDGRPNIIVAGGTGWTQFEAEARAGKLRDGMSDDEVNRSIKEGWTFQAVTCRGTARARVAFIPGKDSPAKTKTPWEK